MALQHKADVRAQLPVIGCGKLLEGRGNALGKGVEIGAGWLRLGQMSGKEYVSLLISAPELGSKTLYANLGRAAGETDPNVYALIWNPRE
jgi:uncharacterized protein (DUF736 family)